MIRSDSLSSCGFFKIKKNCQNVVCSFPVTMQRIDHFPEPFDSGDFKFQKIAFTKLQLEAGNGYQLYKSVHKNGKKKSNLFVNITVDKISLTLCAVLSLN